MINWFPFQYVIPFLIINLSAFGNTSTNHFWMKKYIEKGFHLSVVGWYQYINGSVPRASFPIVQVPWIQLNKIHYRRLKCHKWCLTPQRKWTHSSLNLTLNIVISKSLQCRCSVKCGRSSESRSGSCSKSGKKCGVFKIHCECSWILCMVIMCCWNNDH